MPEAMSFPQICKIVELSASLDIAKNSPQHITATPSAEILRANQFSGLCHI